MNRCSERAFAMCPNRHLCGTIHEATFTDNSDCAEFNKKVDSIPMTNADRIRAMSDEELAEDFCKTVLGVMNQLGVVNTGSVEDAVRKRLEWLKQPAEVEHE